MTFWFFCKGAALPTPEVLAYAIDGSFFLEGGACDRAVWEVTLSRESCFFLKDVFGCCAQSVYKVTVTDGTFWVDGVRSSLPDLVTNRETFLCQRAITNHAELHRLNPNAVNTVRFITLCTAKTKYNPVLIVPPVLRVGASVRGVDNWAAGGVIIRIDNDGCLGPYGFYKPTYVKTSGKTAHHPISGLPFQGIRVPFYEEAKKLVVHAHRLMDDLTIVGWDVAITPEVPVLIEGNDNPEISLHQITSGPLRKTIEAIL